MPLSKKGSGNPPKAAAEQAITFQEGSDPVAHAISIIDKKVRNLEKRRVSWVLVGVFFWGGGGGSGVLYLDMLTYFLSFSPRPSVSSTTLYPLSPSPCTFIFVCFPPSFPLPPSLPPSLPLEQAGGSEGKC